MRKLFVLLAIATLVFTSCDDFGTKVAINDKSDVYYKGEGITEADAKNLGTLLSEMSFFSNTGEQKSVQLTKEKDTYFVRFVIDQNAYEKNKEAANSSFRLIQGVISESLFAGSPTKVVLTDNKFEDVAQIGELTTEEKETISQLNQPDTTATATTPTK